MTSYLKFSSGVLWEESGGEIALSNNLLEEEVLSTQYEKFLLKPAIPMDTKTFKSWKITLIWVRSFASESLEVILFGPQNIQRSIL